MITVAARIGNAARSLVITAVDLLAIFTEIAKIVSTRADDALDDIQGRMNEKGTGAKPAAATKPEGE